MKVNADRSVCIGAGMCALTAPAVFDQDDDEGLVVLLTEEIPDDRHEVVCRAVTLCPSGALSLENDPSS
ncbi:ferredoxin [Nonomuraea longicatena]|uniref:Ferredoxin n=1 Tax=Nonomuraea longicatena TaxID=83682 RepID=A0ABP4A6X8_9ACTN